MESPPRPKRFVGTINNLSSLSNPIQHCSDNLNLMQAENPQAASCSTLALQSFATTPEPVKESETPNLCAFVNEVAVQQQQQIDEFEACLHLLESKTRQLNSLKELHMHLIEESKSIKRRSFLALEESTKQRSKITWLRDEILILFAEERQHQKSVKIAKSHDFQPFKENYQKKMRLHEEKVRTNLCNSEVSKAISKCKLSITEYRSEMEKITFSLNSQNLPNEVQLENKISALKAEKDKLLNILQRKKEAVQEEEKKIRSFAINIENSVKRVAAQKLRLRNRIAEKRRLMQRFEEEAAVLQIEIDDLSNN